MGGAASLLSTNDVSKRRLMSIQSAMHSVKNSMIPGVSSPKSIQLSDVDRELLKAQKEEQYIHKILLLGAGECGKSTVLKQIKLLNKVALTEREIEEYKTNIRRNAIEAIQTLLLVGGELGEQLDSSELMQDVERILELDMYESKLTPDIATTISLVWNDPGLQRIYARREFYHLMDAAPYYLNEVQRLAAEDYVCTEEDTIMCRVRTTGMVMTEIKEGLFTYQIVDVGGQRSERRKWIHCFDNVRSIVFLEGLSGYNQVLFEDTRTNRMRESLNLFTEVVKNPAFKNTPIFVFLNKKDLFEEMIVLHPLKKCFPDYLGPEHEARPALAFIEQKYKDIYNNFHGIGPNGYLKNGKKHVGGIFIQIIAARVRMDMKMAFGQVKDKLKELFPIS